MAGFEIFAFDVVFGVILFAGFIVGRKRGMSGELLDLIKWAAIVFGGGAVYNPAASYLVSVGAGQLSLGFCQMTCYLLWACLMWAVFGAVRRSTGDKLLQADVFGRLEYYLGMLAGMLRFALITLFLLALLNAKQVSPAELAEERRKALDLYGSNYFPSIGQSQEAVFRKSAVGKFVKRNFEPQLVRLSGAPPSAPSTPARRRNFDDLMNGK